MIVGRVCVAAILWACVASDQANAAPLDPVKGWVLDYAEAQCVAYRDYGKPDNPITLAIRPAPNGETYEILVARRSPAPDFAEELQGTVDFGGRPINAWLLHYRSAKTKLDIYQFRIKAAEMAGARSAKAVTLHIKSAPDFAFTLASIPQLLNGLEACTADLIKYWNIGRSEGGAIATPPKGNVRGVFSGDDYPWEALTRGQEGTAQYLLLIDEKGGVAGCHVVKPSGVPVLDAMGCVVIQKRAKFTPAKDANGKAIRSATVTPPVSWRLEG